MNRQFMDAVFLEGHDVITLGNWQATFLSYLEYAYEYTGTERRQFKAQAARLLEQAYFNGYIASGMSASAMKADLYSLLSEGVRIPSFFYDRSDTIGLPGKPQPSFEESISATFSRLEIMEKIKDIFKDSVEAIFAGGSMAYGPFFNIRGGLGGSDIDLIVVVDDNNFFKKGVLQKNSQSRLLLRKDRELFEYYGLKFRKLQIDGLADTFSHRFDTIDRDFDISVHFIPRPFFVELYVAQLTKDLFSDQDITFIVRDFRGKPFEYLRHDRSALDGSIHSFDVLSRMYEDGFLVNLPGYFIDHEKWYQGNYHQVTQPQVVTLYDRSNCEAILAEHYGMMQERLAQERLKFEHVDFLNAHVRAPIFAPDRYDFFPTIRRLTDIV
jgi:predicted nucleotidyltransferase